MVHRLTENRLFMIALAALMLLAFMPWASGPCCCGADEAATTGTCCGTPPNPGPETPETPGPCPCIQVGKSVGLLAVVASNDSGQASVVLHPTAGPIVADSPMFVPLRAPKPRARTGPRLHLRLQVLLI